MKKTEQLFRQAHAMQNAIKGVNAYLNSKPIDAISDGWILAQFQTNRKKHREILAELATLVDINTPITFESGLTAVLKQDDQKMYVEFIESEK